MAAEDRIDGYASAILEFATAEDQLERVGDELFPDRSRLRILHAAP